MPVETKINAVLPPGLRTLERQFLFAVRKAMNNLTEVARDESRQAVRQSVTVRGTWITRKGIGINATFAKGNSPVLFTTVEMGGDWLEGVETGKTRTPQRSRHLGSPTSIVRKRGATHKITPAKRPRALLSGGGGRNKPFKLPTRNANVDQIIVRRVGRGKKKRLEVLYFLVRRQPFVKRNLIVPATESVFANRDAIVKKLEENLRKAIESAR